ncbi:hypothetical protein Mal64_32050 [Pseudobythopirellula maris]|uniref:Uncharacterized protein n=1 Tax=Pseudobythopirellula maris TaxID=2527991 RepID=A0A5C5ZMJ6_9BACT|nr:hypothetical protein [Pseudobythopirellula maris]TWT87663.1 hypothetical protein Mal64_32050 [Pseudobythopirellula maris]
MFATIKNLTFAATLTALLASLASPVLACGGGGGGGYRGGGYNGYRGGYSRPAYSAPVRRVYSQPAPVQQPIQQQFAGQPQAAPQQFAPQQQATQQLPPAPQAQPVAQQPAQQAAPANAAQGTAAQSALALLASMGGQSPAPAAAPAAGQVGVWTATLSNGTTVRLELGANSNFSWTAIKDGKASSFQGSYSVANGQLVLVRSTDQQQLRGAWTALASGGFNFRLDGGKDNGLNFARS